MKIYADSSIDTSTPFDEFVGKDVWVRVQCTFGNRLIIYVRFIERTIGGTPISFLCNWVLAQKYDAGKLHSLDYNSRIFFASELELLSPVTPLSSADLFSDSEIDSAKTLGLFSRLAGKDLYVLAEDQRVGVEFYVKVNSLRGNVVDLQYIDAGIVDCSDEDYYDGWEHSPWCHIHHTTVFIDAFSIIEPIDILTGEELSDILNHLDEIYQQHIDDQDYDEEDEEDEE